MRFLRHLGAVLAVVAVVVLAGLAWAHFGPGTLASGPQTPFQQEVVTSQPGSGLPSADVQAGSGAGLRSFDLGLGAMFNPANLPNLRHTVEIEAGVIAAVVIIDVYRRRSRRAWREAQLAADAQEPDDEP